MKILDVFIEHGKASLDRPFSYAYSGNKRVEPMFRVLVLFNKQLIVGFVFRVRETDLSLEELSKESGFQIREVLDVIDQEPLLTPELNELSQEVADYYLAPRISVLQSILPPSLRPAKSSLKEPKIAYEKWVRLKDPSEEGLSTAKQKEMLRLLAKNHEMLKKEVGSPSVLERLLSLGKAEIFLREKERFHIEEFEKERPHPLTAEQQDAFEKIWKSPKQVVLLQGVTGSGKTEVYLHLSERYLKEGKNVLMMVPEISLTPVMVEYFGRRFKDDIAILHSGLTPAEKYDEYRKIAQGKAHIVVGARSAVFAPLSNIGLIILDEEHVSSYKQEGVPSYHAREVAIMRAKHFGAKVVLGSATPSLESKARAMKGVYEYVSLPHRINRGPLPKAEIVDLKDRSLVYHGTGAHAKDNYDIFSKRLIEEIQKKLEAKEQVILLLNRRGYTPYIGCHDCGYVYVCPNCGSFLSYHDEDHMLKCHHCDYVAEYTGVCPKCGSTAIKRAGFGTERVIKKLGEIFPKAKLCRLDSDSAKARQFLQKTLREFHDGAYDILVGTQMIAKGHDFPNVTLVGVCQADTGLYTPSYRANENTFELLAQAVGRSGRASKPGEAIIQTYNPDNYAISLGAKQDYEAFYRKEMEARRNGHFPPYYYLVLIHVAAKGEDKAASAAHDIKEDLLKQSFPQVEAVGPSTPYIALWQGKYQRTILVKYRSRESLFPYLKRLGQELSGRAGVDITFDVDPLEN